MALLSERARARLIQWMERNPNISQTDVGRSIGHGQGWVSKYKRGEQEADIDDLDGMARVYGHTLIELIDLRPDPIEQRLLDAFRSLPPDDPKRRQLAIDAIEAMLPAPRKARRSSGTQ